MERIAPVLFVSLLLAGCARRAAPESAPADGARHQPPLIPIQPRPFRRPVRPRCLPPSASLKYAASTACQPVRSTSSSRSRDFPARSAPLYAKAFFFVTAWRWAIVSSMKTGITRDRRPHPEPRRYAEFSNEATYRAMRGFSMSQRGLWPRGASVTRIAQWLKNRNPCCCR